MSEFQSDQWPMNHREYELGSLIGRGAFAKVFRAKVLNGVHAGKNVAVKVIDLEQFPDSTMEEIRRELTTMKMCRHPNVMTYEISFIVGTHLWLVMPLLEGGSCLSLMRSVCPQGIRDTAVLAYILHEALQALKYLHSQAIVHRDLKAGNVLLSSRAEVLLADFGVSASLKENKTRTTFVGTPCWMAPEVLEQRQGYDWRADIWSIGVTCIELAQGEAPFQRHPPLKVMMMVLQKEPQSLDPALGLHPSLTQFAAACMQKDPMQRPSADQLLQMFAPLFQLAEQGKEKLESLVRSAPVLVDRGTFVDDAAQNVVERPLNDFNWNFSEDEEEKTENVANHDDEDPFKGLGETE